MSTAPTLTIRQIADQSGINEATLRMWESRHGFPRPERLASGHRRYSERDLDAVRSVVRARAEGLSLASAIDRARRLEEEPDPSVFGALRERFPQLQPFVLPKRVLIRLSHALEDECCLRARRPILFASFQHERFYRSAEDRWREISRTADTAIVFADFAKVRRPRGAPVEVPLAATDELMREWVIVCDASDISACLVAWERPRGKGQPRRFEAIWTVERDVVRHAARACAELAARVDPALAAGVRERLAGPAVEGDAEVRHAVALATRMVFYALEGEQ